MAASQHGNSHARNGSNYSFTAANASFSAPRPSGDANRQSTISFATRTSPNKQRHGGAGPRPMSAASFPRLGQNGHRDPLGPLSPEQESPEQLGGSSLKPFQRAHAHQRSVASSLRNQVSMFDEEHLAAAVSVINGERDLKSSVDRPTSTLSYATAPSSQASLNQSQNSLNQSQRSTTGHHGKQESIVSLKMPRLDRASTMTPDNALAAYAQGKRNLKVTTHVPSRSLPSNNPYNKNRLSGVQKGMPTSSSDSDLQVAYGMAS
jgi:hypothetical protein